MQILEITNQLSVLILLLRSRKTKWPSPDPHPLAEHNQHEDDTKRRRDDRSLNPEADLCPLLLSPLHLEVRDDEAAKRAREVEVRADLAASLGVAVEAVTTDSDGGDHDAVHIKTPRDGQGHEVPRVLERLADEHEADDHEREREEDGAQAHLGLEVALVGLDIALC